MIQPPHAWPEQIFVLRTAHRVTQAGQHPLWFGEITLPRKAHDLVAQLAKRRSYCGFMDVREPGARDQYLQLALPVYTDPSVGV